MRIFVAMLALIVSVAHGSEPFKFPFVGKVRIGEATKYWDGGSVMVVLHDERAQYTVHYRTREAGEANGGGLLTFVSKKDGKRITLPRGSDDEGRLLNYLRSASVVTYGTSNPNVLRNSGLTKGISDGFDRLAIASLLRHFEEEKKPNNAEMAAPRKPSD
jgi:hypothetical protein